MPADAPAPAGAAEWSDEEGHDPSKDAQPVLVGEAGERKEKSGLALKIEEREKREADEEKRKAEIREKLAPTPDMKGLKGKALEKAKQKQQQEVRAPPRASQLGRPARLRPRRPSPSPARRRAARPFAPWPRPALKRAHSSRGPPTSVERQL